MRKGATRSDRHLLLWTLVLAVATILPGSPQSRAAEAAKEQAVNIVLRGDNIASPSLTAVDGKKCLYVSQGVRVKLTVKSEDKTYKLAIAGKAGAVVTVEKGKTSSPIHLQFTKAGEEYEIQISVDGKQVSSGLYMKVK